MVRPMPPFPELSFIRPGRRVHRGAKRGAHRSRWRAGPSRLQISADTDRVAAGIRIISGGAMKDLHQLGVVESAAAIRSGEITAEPLAPALLQRAKALS